MKNFRKIFLIVFVIIFVILLLAAGILFLFLRNFDIQKYKPQIVASLKQALDRDVELSSLSLNFSWGQGIGLTASGLKISDDQKFSSKSFFCIDQIKVGVDVLGFISRHQINIPNVEIVAPRISIIRNDDGVFNFQTLGFLQPGNKGPQAQVVSPSHGVNKPSLALAAILVQNIFIRNGDVSFKDNFEEERSLEIKKIDLKVSDFSPVRPFKFLLQAACFGDKQNLSLSGNASLDALNAAVILKNLQSKLDLSSVDARPNQSLSSVIACSPLRFASRCDE